MGRGGPDTCRFMVVPVAAPPGRRADREGAMGAPVVRGEGRMNSETLERRLRGATVRIVDTETTGLTGTDGLVEVAIVQIDELFSAGPAGEPRPLFHSLVDPLVPSPWAGTCAHGLTVRDVVGAPTWAEVRPAVLDLLNDPAVVPCAHNAPFDRRFLCAYQVGEVPPVLPEAALWLDTMRILQRLDPTPGRAKLDAACRARRLTLDGHRAQTDAMATGRLLGLLIREAYELPPGERPPPRPTVGQWFEWQRKGRKGPKTAEGQEALFGGLPETETARATRERRARTEASSPWVVRGGVGGTMYCGAASGIYPFKWVHRADQARKFVDEDQAREVAARVSGRAERVPL
jgi:DNA polymerase III epsilon subunit-like protein